MTEPEPLAELTNALLPEDREWLGQHGWKAPPPPAPLTDAGRRELAFMRTTMTSPRGHACWNVADLLRRRSLAPAPKRRPKHRLNRHDMTTLFLAADLFVAVILVLVWWGWYDDSAERARIRSTPIEVQAPVTPGSAAAEVVCSTYATVLGSYDPATHTPGADRDNYEHVFTQLRATYQQLGCH